MVTKDRCRELTQMILNDPVGQRFVDAINSGRQKVAFEIAFRFFENAGDAHDAVKTITGK
jgi:hypothetical protein